MTVTTRLLRPDDLLNLQVEGINLRLDGSAGETQALVVDDHQQPGYLIYTFPPQSIAEGAYYEAAIVPADARPGPANPDQPATPPAQDHLVDSPVRPGSPASGQRTVAQIAHPSRLVFRVPDDARIPYSTESLLDWSGLTLNVNGIAAIGPNPTSAEIAAAPAIQRPGQTETAIEMPYRLTISPGSGVAWDHRRQPFVNAGQCEMWHTRMFGVQGGVPVEPTADTPIALRAIWSDDFDSVNPIAPPKTDPDLGRTAMSPNDRSQIVVLTSAFHGYEADYNIFLALALAPVRLGNALEAPENLAAPAAGPFPVARAGGLLPAAAALQAGINSRPFRVTRPFVPQPFYADELFLSPLGGWLRSRGAWNPLPRQAPAGHIRLTDLGALIAQIGVVAAPGQPPARRALDAISIGDRIREAVANGSQAHAHLDLSEWVHVAAEGRDHYVRIVYEGELWPFRHPAALVKVTERKFIEHDGLVEAHLVQRNYIVVRQPERVFSNDDRGTPLKRVRLTTLVTPSIAEPQIIGPTHRTFWVDVLTAGGGRTRFPFHGVGTDLTGASVDFTLPLLFVSVSDLTNDATRAPVRDAYNAKQEIAARSLQIPGQKLTFAPSKVGAAGQQADNTRLATRTLNFVVDAAGSPPQMLMADVNLPQVQQLLQTDASTTIRFFKSYLDKGIDDAANQTGVFAEVVKQDLTGYTSSNPFGGVIADKLGVSFTSDKAGGFATPDMGVSALTSALGPLAGDVTKAAADQFDPGAYFPPGGLAKIFGSFDLADLLPPLTHDKNAPKITTDTQDIAGGKIVIVKLDWTPEINSKDLGIAAFVKDHNGTSALKIHGKVQKPIKLDGLPNVAEATTEFTGALNDFQVSVLSSVFVNFVLFSFKAVSGKKPDVTVKLDTAAPVEFAGDLKFVEELRKAIPPGLFGDGPSLDIAPTGIRAGFELALPPLAIGVFALKDVALGAAVTLPFLDGKPSFDFNVSQRCHPFQVAVAFFAGGGFFHLELDTAGMKQLEAAIEFGAAASIDIGVASGEVHMMAGIYFSLQRKEGSSDLSCTLTGYLRLGGSLSVLGLVKISVEFNLSFTYKSEPGGSGKAYGRATLTVQVEVLFFSKSVELTVEKSFGGSSGDPHFLDEFNTAESWNEYALAFA